MVPAAACGSTRSPVGRSSNPGHDRSKSLDLTNACRVQVSRDGAPEGTPCTSPVCRTSGLCSGSRTALGQPPPPLSPGLPPHARPEHNQPYRHRRRPSRRHPGSRLPHRDRRLGGRRGGCRLRTGAIRFGSGRSRPRADAQSCLGITSILHAVVGAASGQMRGRAEAHRAIAFAIGAVNNRAIAMATLRGSAQRRSRCPYSREQSRSTAGRLDEARSS